LLDLGTIRQAWTDEVVDDADIAPFLVRDADQLAAVGQLRYRLFIERDGKPYPFADHLSRSFLEPIDEISLNFAVADGGACLAGVRLTRAVDAVGDPQLKAMLDHAGVVPADLPTIAVNSRMVVAETGRARILIPRLFRQIYRAGGIAGMKSCLACSRSSGTALFERFGFVRVGAFHDAVAGDLVVLRLNATDAQHLQATSSPFLTVYKELFEERAVPAVEAVS